MATRDLTRRFTELRAEAKAKRPPQAPATADGAAPATPGDKHLLDDAEKGGPDWSAARKQLPPDWVDDVDKVEQILKEIQSKSKDLDALHRKRLLAFDDSAEAREERAIEDKTEEITQLFRQAQAVVDKMKKNQKGDESDSELRVRRNIQRSLAFKINELTTKFRGSQKEYWHKLKSQKEGAAGGGFEFLTKKDDPVATGPVDGGFSEIQLAVMDNLDIVVNERDQEIKQIAQSITELAAIMKNLQELVIDQGTLLDRIDYNIDEAVDKVKAGIVELEATEKIQQDGTAFKCIIALMCLVFILILAMVIKHSKK